MSQDRGWALHLGTCACGKRSYGSRDKARAARRNGVNTRDLHAYRCDDSGYWHLGHLPEPVRRGEIDRRTMFGGRG